MNTYITCEIILDIIRHNCNNDEIGLGPDSTQRHN